MDKYRTPSLSANKICLGTVMLICPSDNASFCGCYRPGILVTGKGFCRTRGHMGYECMCCSPAFALQLGGPSSGPKALLFEGGLVFMSV